MLSTIARLFDPLGLLAPFVATVQKAINICQRALCDHRSFMNLPGKQRSLKALLFESFPTLECSLW